MSSRKSKKVKQVKKEITVFNGASILDLLSEGVPVTATFDYILTKEPGLFDDEYHIHRVDIVATWYETT